jgi:ABC-type amino acid transport substrate-binding protein
MQNVFKSTFTILLSVLFIFLVAAQCQPEGQSAIPTQEPATPIVALIPPIPTGDGTDLIDRLLAEGVIRVGIRVWPGPDFSPPAFRGFSNAETGGALNGFEVDVAHQIADGLGLELELVEAYPPALATGQWQGEWDIAIASLVPFDQSPETMIYSQVYGYIPLAVLVPANSTIQGPNDLAGKRVGVLEHSAAQRLLASAGLSLTVEQQPVLASLPANVQPVPVSNLLNSIKQLGTPHAEAEALDAIIGPVSILQQALKSELPVKLAAPNIGVQPLAIAIVPQDELKIDRLVAEINNTLARLHRDGTLAEIYVRWYEQDFSQTSSSDPAPEK